MIFGRDQRYRPAKDINLPAEATAVEVAQQLVEALRPLMRVYLDTPTPWYSAGTRQRPTSRVAIRSERHAATWGDMDDVFALYSNALRFLEQNGVAVDRRHDV